MITAAQARLTTLETVVVTLLNHLRTQDIVRGPVTDELTGIVARARETHLFPDETERAGPEHDLVGTLVDAIRDAENALDQTMMFLQDTSPEGLERRMVLHSVVTGAHRRQLQALALIREWGHGHR